MYPNNSNQDDQYMKSPPPPPPSAPPAAANYNDYPHHPPVTGIPVPVQNYAGIPVPAQPPAQFDTATHPGYWSSGLCDCGSDVPNCFITIFCPCITFGQISEIVDKGSTSCGVSAALYALLAYFTGCACIYSCFYRSRLRSQYMLPESPCADFLVHCCCEPCALCQEYRELKHRGFDMSIGWHGNMERQNREVTMAPIAQQRMDR